MTSTLIVSLPYEAEDRKFVRRETGEDQNIPMRTERQAIMTHEEGGAKALAN